MPVLMSFSLLLIKYGTGLENNRRPLLKFEHPEDVNINGGILVPIQTAPDNLRSTTLVNTSRKVHSTLKLQRIRPQIESLSCRRPKRIPTRQESCTCRQDSQMVGKNNPKNLHQSNMNQYVSLLRQIETQWLKPLKQLSKKMK